MIRAAFRSVRNPALAALLALAPAAASAATPGAIPAGPSGVLTTFAGPGSATYRARLQGGRDYALEGASDEDFGSVELRDAGGRARASAPVWNQATEGATFRAAYSGDFFVTVALRDESESGPGVFPAAAWLAVDADCAAAPRTLCTLPVGSTRTNRLFNYAGDHDWFRVALRAGRFYTVRLDIQGEYGGVTVRDGAGRVVVPFDPGREAPSYVATFRPRTGGTYYVETLFDGDGQARYALGLTAR